MSLRRSLLPGAEPHPEDSSSLPSEVAPSTPPLSSDSDLGESLGGSSSSFFRPTEAQSRAKARYWARRGPLLPTEGAPTLAEIKRLTDSSSIDRWAKQRGFLEWFLNADALEERVAHLTELSMDALEDMILNTDPKAQSARVNAIKVIIDLRKAQLDPSKRAAEAAKDAVKGMDRDELVRLLEASGANVVTQINVSSKNKDDEE